jgi:phage gp29-like protein
MALSVILGPDGKPLEKDALTQDLSEWGSGFQPAFYPNVARGMTPERMADILERSCVGDADDFLTLCEEMEERDGHYRSIMMTRKLAVAGLPRTVEAASDSALDVEIADGVRNLAVAPGFTGMLMNGLDGLGKGYGVTRQDWDRSEVPWKPVYCWQDQRWFFYDRRTLRELRRRSIQDPAWGVPLEPYRWIVHQPQTKSGLPIRAGLARVCALLFLFKQYTLKNWVAVAEVLGLPMRLGVYGANTTPEDKAVLRRAVASIGTDLAAIVPQSVEIKFIEAKNSTGSTDLQKVLIDALDSQMSKAVLGQDMTTHSKSLGLGSQQANVGNDVREDLQMFDAEELTATVNGQMVIPWVNINYGPQKAYPRVVIRVPKPEDLKALSGVLKDLVPLGLEVEQSVIRDKWGLPEPKPGAKLLSAPAPVPAAPGGGFPALNRRLALNAAAAQFYPMPAPALAQNLNNAAQPAYDAMLAPVIDLVQHATSYEEILDGLAKLYPTMDDSELQALLTEASAAAYLAGRFEVAQGR